MAEYIEREAALDIVNGWREQLIPTYGENDEYVKCLETVAEHLESLHAADVRPVVKAKWELDNDKLPICSNCGEIALQRVFVKFPHLIQDVRMVKSNFCPNCGANMMEES